MSVSQSTAVVLTLTSAAIATVHGQAAAQAPPGAPVEVSQAQAALAAGHPDSAIAILQGFYAKNPDARAGRLVLGNAWRQKGDFAKALVAYQSVTQPRPARFQAMFHAAEMHARLGHTDQAIQVLTRIKAGGAYDMDLARTAPDLESVRNDPRFESVLWHPEDFTTPFVEPVRIIHEWVGETRGDQFSWIARGIGDVDGDRVSDVVTSAPTYQASSPTQSRGRVYLYSGKTGTLLWKVTGQDGEALGTGLEGAGDVNRDGIPDVIAGAPGGNKAYVYSGRDGAVLLTLRGLAGETFGNAAAGAGDQNGDGHADLIVGAPGSSAAGQAAGRAYVHSGRDGTLLFTLDGEKAGDRFGSIVAGDNRGRGTPVLVGAGSAGPSNRGRVYQFVAGSRTPTLVIEADSTGAALGAMFTSLVGDVDGDSVLDIYASDYVNSAKGPSTGRVYVHSGKDGRRLLQLTGEQAGDGFGIGSAEAGDVNGDGHDDLVVGAWQYSGAAGSGGKIYVFSGKNGALLRAITGRVPGETFGFDATGIGDVDGDTVPDLLLTSSWSHIKGFRTGRMFVISGR